MKRISILLCCTLFLAAGTAFAQGGSDALSFTRIDRNPVTSAIAGSGAAFSGTVAYSAFSHAAMLPFFQGALDAGAGFQYWTPGLSASANVSVGAAYKIKPWLGLSLGYALENGASYEVYKEVGQPSGTFYPKNHVVALGAGFGLGELFSIGLNVRYARQIPAPGRVYQGVGADLFGACRLSNGLTFTAGVANLGTAVKSGELSFRQPASAKVAAGWGTVFAEEHALDLLADADYYFSNHFSVSAGLQYAWNRTIFVRAGYRFATEGCFLPSHLALGLGVQFSGFHLDVSYLTASPALGNTVNIGLGYSF